MASQVAPRQRRTGLVPLWRNRKTVSCTTCGKSIIWALTETGKRMPVDAQQNALGRVLLCYEVDGLNNAVGEQLVVAAPADHPGWPRWSNHFATCTKATPFRRRQADRGEL